MKLARFASVIAATCLLACEEMPPPEPPPQPPPPPPLRAPSFEAPPAVEPHTLEVKLAPATSTAGAADAAHVGVSLRFSEPPGEFAEPGPLVLILHGDADAIEDVNARDAEGPLTLRAKANEWRSERRPIGAVSVGYKVKLGRAEGDGARAIAGGFSGSGAAMLMLPETPDAYRVRIAWDLAAAGEGARAVSSLGSDDLRVTMDRLRGAIWMAGPIGRMSIEEGAARFEGAWIGRPGIDPLEVMPFAARVRAQAQAVLAGSANPGVFSVFLSPAQGPTLRASERADALLVGASEGAPFSRSARFALAASLSRPWIGLRVEGPEGASRWLTAGFAAHFAREILLRGGLATPEEAADDLRESVERYAENEARALSNEAIAKRIAEPAVQQAAADRGMLYAADADAAVRAKSGGKRSLGDVVKALAARAHGADPLPAGAFRQAIGAELGPEGEARFDAIIGRGEAFTPPDGAFGPCFKAVKKRVGKVNVTIWARDPKVPCPRGGR